MGASSDPTPMKPSKETRRVEGRGQPEGSPRGKARVRTQSRVALPPNLERVNAAARQAAQTMVHFPAVTSMRPPYIGRFGDRSGRGVLGSMG